MKKGLMNWAPYIGLLIGLLAVGYLYVGDTGLGGLFDLEDNTTTDTTTYSLSVNNLSAVALETGDVKISFGLVNEDQFNISSVLVYYALNVADPSNATFSNVTAVKNTETGLYEATINATFNDVVYYYIEITYDGGTLREPETGFNSITVSDTYEPTINNVTAEYDATTSTVTLTVSATDNDAINTVTLYYAFSNTNDFSNVTFSNVTLSAEPWQFTIDATGYANYYLGFYVEAEDLAGNVAALGNATEPLTLYLNETKTVAYPSG